MAITYLVNTGKLDPSQIKFQSGKISYIFGAFLLIALPSILAIFRWFLLLRGLGNKMSFFSTMKLGFIGTFFNTFMLGAFGGDLVKIGYIIKQSKQKTEAIASIFADRISGLIGLLIVGGIAIIANWQEIIKTPSLHLMAIVLFSILVLVVLCLMTAILSVISSRKVSLIIIAILILMQSLFLRNVVLSNSVTGLTMYIHSAVLSSLICAAITAVIVPSIMPTGSLHSFVRLKVPLGKKLMEFIDSFMAYRHSAGSLITAIILSILIQFSAILAIIVLANAIGNNATAPQIFFAAPATFIANVLPVPMGGLGVGEGVFDALLRLCRDDTGKAITGGATLFLSWRFLIISFGLLFGLPSYLSGKKEIEQIEKEYADANSEGVK